MTNNGQCKNITTNHYSMDGYLKLIDIVKKILFDEEGATAVEYAIMASAIAAVIVAVVLSIGIKVNSLFEAAKDAMTSNGI